jgi:hypothetical protein
MDAIYRACDEKLSRDVAVRVLAIGSREHLAEDHLMKVTQTGLCGD